MKAAILIAAFFVLTPLNIPLKSGSDEAGYTEPSQRRT